MPNSLLLSLLAAAADDEPLVRAMGSATFGLTGTVGEAGFGATTLDGFLVLFTHPEFYTVAGLPEGLDAVEATARQVAEYARATELRGFVLNPGTHQRFVGVDAIESLMLPRRPPAPPTVPPLAPWSDPSPEVVAAVLAAAETSEVEAAWLAAGGIVVTRPHPDPAFEAGLLARDVRLRSFAAEPNWAPAFSRETAERSRIRLGPLPQPLQAALAADLAKHARIHRLEELWAFVAIVGDANPVLAFAYSPHPHDAFARDFNVLHERHALGANVPLLSASELRDALPRIGTPLL